MALGSVSGARRVRSPWASATLVPTMLPVLVRSRPSVATSGEMRLAPAAAILSRVADG
jgi:hypothetical protein